jgi:hypothetical protein
LARNSGPLVRLVPWGSRSSQSFVTPHGDHA